MNSLDHILSLYPTFSLTEKKIADYIIKETTSIPNLTIAELAKKSQVSEASITRFCKKIGVAGFHGLKINLAKVTTEEVPNKEETKLSQQLNRIRTNKLEEINQTLNYLDEEQLQLVLTQFKQAKKVIFLAYGNTIPVAMDAAYRFNQIGIFSVAYDIWDTSLSALMNATKEDLVVVISNSGETKEIIKAVTWCQKHQLKVIAMTNSPTSPVALLADIHLMTATRERVFQKDYYFSRISAMLLMETIFLLLSFEDSDRLDKIRNHEELISDSKI